jgi:hypothetical protein
MSIFVSKIIFQLVCLTKYVQKLIQIFVLEDTDICLYHDEQIAQEDSII